MYCVPIDSLLIHSKIILHSFICRCWIKVATGIQHKYGNWYKESSNTSLWYMSHFAFSVMHFNRENANFIKTCAVLSVTMTGRNWKSTWKASEVDPSYRAKWWGRLANDFKTCGPETRDRREDEGASKMDDGRENIVTCDSVGWDEEEAGGDKRWASVGSKVSGTAVWGSDGLNLCQW